MWGRLELKSSLRRTDKSPKTSDDRHSVVDRWVRELLGGNKTAMDSRHKAAEGIGKLKEPKDLERARAATRQGSGRGSNP